MLDRDGTINVERQYLADPAGVELMPGAAEGIRRLNEARIPVALVTNQSALARGFLSHEGLDAIHARLQYLLSAQGAHIDRVYVCPHHPDDGCTCRKPLPALALRAAEDLHADLSLSYVVGDNACDMGLGRVIGATTILVRTGYGAQLEESGRESFAHAVDDLLGAADVILRTMT
jgi:histidinol-phosphate phosphatase family protein